MAEFETVALVSLPRTTPRSPMPRISRSTVQRASMLASTLGIGFDPDAARDKRRGIYATSHLILDSMSLTAEAQVGSDGRWICAVAAAVFRFDPPAHIEAR